MSSSQVPLHKRGLVEERPAKLVEPGDIQFILAAMVTAAMQMIPSARRPHMVMQLSERLGALWYSLNMRDVRRVRSHMRLLLGDLWVDAEIESHVRRQLSLTVWNYLILNLIPSISPKQAENLLPIDGLEHLDQAIDMHQPLLLLGAHVGPYAYPIAAMLLARHYAVREVGHAQPRQGSSIIYRKLYWPRVSKTIEHLAVVNTLEGMSKAVLDILRADQILYLLPDQFYIVDQGYPPSPHLVQVTFLRRLVNLETGGLRLAKRLGARVFTALPTYEQGMYHIHIQPLELPTDGLRPADLATDLRAFMEQVEQCIYRQPFLWRDLRRSDLLQRLGVDEPGFSIA